MRFTSPYAEIVPAELSKDRPLWPTALIVTFPARAVIDSRI